MAREKNRSKVFDEMRDAVKEFSDLGAELTQMILIIQMFIQEEGLLDKFEKWLVDNKESIEKGMKDGA